jgi:hypothetical protein
MKSKLFLTIIIGIMLISCISALDFDNTVDYTNKDMTAEINNRWDIEIIGGGKIGEVTLTSHLSVDEVRKVIYGDKREVMCYDFNFSEIYYDGLGDVEFINEVSGEKIQRDYYFAIKTKESFEYQDCDGVIEETDRCKLVTGEKDKYTELTNRDVPKKGEICLMADVYQGDYIDGIWKIAGKRIEKHATWKESFNKFLDVYFDGNSSTGNINGWTMTANHGTMTFNETDCLIGKCGQWDESGTTYNVSNARDSQSLDFIARSNNTLNVWLRYDGQGSSETYPIYFQSSTANANWRMELDTDPDLRKAGNGATSNRFRVPSGKLFMLTVVAKSSNQFDIYINGTLKQAGVSEGGAVNVPDLIMGNRLDGNAKMYGVWDELAIWNNTLNASTITDLYNGGSGLTYVGTFTPPDTAPVPSLSIPINNTNTTNPSITFNCSATDDIDLVNLTLVIDGVDNETVTFGSVVTFGDLQKTISMSDGDYTWTCRANDGVNAPVTAEERLLGVDSSSPTLNIIYPTTNVTEGYATSNSIKAVLNWSSSDTHLQTCWYYNQSTNVTSTCGANATFNLPFGTYTHRVYANDTYGNEGTDSVTISYLANITENSKAENVTTYETYPESLSINVTRGVGSDMDGYLWYNGTRYTPTESVSGSYVYNYNFGNVPLLSTENKAENRSYHWEFVIDGSTSINSSIFSQYVMPINLTNCSAGVEYINYTFKNEDDNSVLNASIPNSVFTYYLGDGTISRSLTFISNVDNFEYNFCFEPKHLDASIDPEVQYEKIDFPQRTYDPSIQTYTNVSSPEVLYLLASADGLYVTFQVVTRSQVPIEGVEVTANRSISGTEYTVAQGTTDDAGGVTFWLNPNFAHTLLFTKEGYDDYETTITPTQTLYTITFGNDTTQTITDYSQEVSIYTAPKGSLVNNTAYAFNFTINSTYWILDEYGFILKYGNGTIISSTSGSVDTGSTLNINADTSTSRKILIEYYHVINSTYFNGSTYWFVDSTVGRDFSITHFFEDLDLYMDANMFGIMGEDGTDNFGKALLAVVFIVLVIGGLTYRYGITSTAALVGILFGIVMFLNTVGFIPNPDFMTRGDLGDFLTYIIAIIAIGAIIREETR